VRYDEIIVANADSDGIIHLSDGPKLSYAEYGDPAGTPIFYFHGFPSCPLRHGWPEN